MAKHGRYCRTRVVHTAEQLATCAADLRARSRQHQMDRLTRHFRRRCQVPRPTAVSMAFRELWRRERAGAPRG